MSRRNRRHQRALEHGFKVLYRTEALGRQGGKCLYCTRPLSVREATAEHRHPHSRGGQLSARNIDAACASCNALKRSYDVRIFKRAIHRPSARRDPFDLHLAGILIRLRRQTERACRRLQKMVA